MNTTKTFGKIIFDPKDITNKHTLQSSWKKIVILEIDGDICDYYAWFLKKRFNLILNKPIRNAHITFINDSLNDIGDGISNWDNARKKYNNKVIEIELYLSPASDGIHWWLPVTEKSRIYLHNIRKEIGLGRPYYGLHMTLGYANFSYDDTFENGIKKVSRDNISHSKYIYNLIKKKLI